MTMTINGNGYPIFEANQVLKYTDLNSLFDYLDHHNRLTRTHLIGIGIVCGLSVTLDVEAPSIRVSPGCGITSEGYLLHLEETRLNHYQMGVSVPAQLFDSTRPANDLTEIPPPYTVIELFAQTGDERRELGQTPDGGVRDGDAVQAFLNDQVLVVVCEPEDEQRDSCLVDCDDRGKDRNFRTHFFLLPRRQEQESANANLSAERLLRRGYGMDNLGEPWQDFDSEELFRLRQDFWQKFELRVRRFGYTQETPQNSTESIPVVRLSRINNYDIFLQSYYEICDRIIDEIATVFPELFQIFSPFFSRFNPNTNLDFSDLGSLLRQHLRAIWTPETVEAEQLEAVETQYAIQYFYDYLSQMVAAYRELVDAAFDLMDDCIPDSRRFPKFLMLGLFSEEAESVCAPPSAYRSHFTQSPIYNGNAQRVKQVQHLYERLRRLCQEDAFYLLPFYDTPLKLTPSKDRSVPLSQQAIPYYLNYPKLYRYWNYDACRKGISERHPAYFYPLTSGSSIDATDDLLHRLDDYNFYRIEGHIGESKTNSLEQIKEYQRRYNLAFDVITLKLSPSADLEDLNLSARFDDLEADFGRMKDKFLKLWDKNEDEWSENVLLNTLRQEFFKQPGLSSLSESRLFNPILSSAKDSSRYQFEAELGSNNQPTGLYRLYIVNAAGTRIAQYVPVDSDRSELINFSRLSPEEIAREQEQIANEISACLSLGKVTYGLELQRLRRRERYRLRFSSEDEFNLPIVVDGVRTTAPISFLSLGSFSVVFDDNENPIISQTEFRDFETLYRLLRDVPTDFALEFQLPYQIGNPEAAECLNYFEFKGLLEAYQQRLERLKELHLFHKFAEYHPGMEHLGGVPQGGTFILVYVDGEDVVNNLFETERNSIFRERTININRLISFPISFLPFLEIQREIFNRADIVVADFCLPYRCCSDTPAVSYLLAKPRPIILLEKSTFCEDDETRYEFILEPEGGNLKGEGSFREEGKYYFQPSRVEGDITSERVITFTYVVEGSYDTFTIAIYPEPSAELSLEDSYCRDQTVDINIISNNPDIILVQLTINGEIVDRFDPSQYAQNGEPETITLEVQVRDRRADCQATITREVTIYPLPDASFILEPPPSVDNGYCAEGGEAGEQVLFQANDPDVSLGFELIENGDSVSLEEPFIYLDNYSSINQPVDLTIIHTAQNEAGCTAQATQSIRIYPIPNANFSLASTQVCSNGANVRINFSANANLLSDTFRAFVGSNEIQGAISSDSSPLFRPSSVESIMARDEVNSLQVRLERTVTGEGGCINSRSQIITVYRTPEADFRMSIANSSRDRVTVRVFSIQPQGNITGLTFQWNTNGGNRDTQSPPNGNFNVTYTRSELANREEIVITLTVYNLGAALYCNRGPVERRLPIPPTPPNFDTIIGGPPRGPGDIRI